jgi:hypothetical protein
MSLTRAASLQAGAKTKFLSVFISHSPSANQASVGGSGRPSILGIISLCLIWLAARPVAFWMANPMFQWDIWSANKLLEYGFWERGGAIIDFHFMTGRVPDPWLFNYANHPYPILWLYTLIYYYCGGAGVIALVAATGLATCLVLYRVLELQFGRSAAWFASVLYALAPASIAGDASANVVALGAVIWPLALWLLCAPTSGQGAAGLKPWGVGLAVFIAGQISWFSLSALPAILWLGLPKDVALTSALRRPWQIPAWRAMGVGALATAGLFLLQLLVYTPSFKDFWHYFLMQSAAASTSPSRLTFLPQVAAKVFYLVGPALWLTAVAAGVCLFKRRKATPIVAAAVCYLAVFGLLALILTRFMFSELSMYRYLLFPTAVLAAFACSQIAGRWLRVVLICLAILGAVFASARISGPSQTSQILGQLIRQQTRPEDVVLTNLRPMAPPYPAWDVGGCEFTRQFADRLMRFGIQDRKAAEAVFPPLRQKSPSCVFIVNVSGPLAKDLAAVLEQHGREVTQCEAVLPAEPASAFLRIRMIYWRLLGRVEASAQAVPDPNGQGAVKLRIYRLPATPFTPEDNQPNQHHSVDR